MKDSDKKAAFGIFAKDYKKYRSEPDKKLYKHLFSLIKRQKKSAVASILDVGCGVGNSTEPLVRNQNVAVSGCDIDERMIKEARSSAKRNKLSITYVTAPAEKLPFSNESFDVVISSAAFHWFANAKAMREIKRVLKKGGFYFVFWQMGKDNGKPTVGVETYKKYKWSGIPQKLRDLDTVKGIFVRAKFGDVKSIQIPTVEKRTVDETLGLIKTNSMYALLTPEQRKDFDRSMKAAHLQTYGKDGIVTTKHDIYVCWGYKA